MKSTNRPCKPTAFVWLDSPRSADRENLWDWCYCKRNPTLKAWIAQEGRVLDRTLLLHVFVFHNYFVFQNFLQINSLYITAQCVNFKTRELWLPIIYSNLEVIVATKYIFKLHLQETVFFIVMLYQSPGKTWQNTARLSLRLSTDSRFHRINSLPKFEW